VIGEQDGYTPTSGSSHSPKEPCPGFEIRTLTIHDEVRSKGPHEIRIYFHLSEECVILNGHPNRYEIDVKSKKITLEADRNLRLETLKGNENPLGGWISKGYHHKVPATTIIGHCICNGTTSFVTRLMIAPDERLV